MSAPSKAGIYKLDTWFEYTVRAHVRGYAQLVRYADDFVVALRKPKGRRNSENKLNLKEIL